MKAIAKYLSVIVIVSMVMGVVLLGCSKPTADGQTNTASKAEGTTINVMVQKHTATDTIQSQLDEFTKATGIKVVMDVLPQDQLMPKTQVLLSSKSKDVDVIMYHYMYTKQFVNSNWLVDLTPYFEKNKVDTKDFAKSFMDAFTFQGKTYGLPLYGESTMLMWNKELFAKVGLTQAPKNKAEFMDAANKLKAAGIPAISMRGDKNPGNISYLWSGFLRAHGGKWFDANGNLAVNSPEAIAATETYAKLLREYSVPSGTTFTWDQVQLAIQQGKVAMAIDATNFSSRIENPKNSSVVGKLGYAVVPQGLSEPSVSTWALAIPSGSKKQDAAFQFINWALSKEVQIAGVVNGDRADVTRTSVLNDKSFTDKNNFDNGSFIKTDIESMAVAKADYLPRILEWNKLEDSINIALSNVVSGQSSAKDALDKVVKECGDIKYPLYDK